MHWLLSYVWLSLIIVTNSTMFLAQTHFDFRVSKAMSGGKTYGIDYYSSKIGIGLGLLWTAVNARFVICSWIEHYCTSWQKVVTDVGKEDQKFGTFVDDKTDKPLDKTDKRRRSCVDIDTGFVRVDHLDSKKRQ